MKTDKSLANKELQPLFGPLKLVAALLSKTWGIQLMNFIGKFSKGKNIEGLHCEERYIPSRSGGPDIRVRIFRPLNGGDGPLPAMLYCHGGGYVIGNPEEFLPAIQRFMDTRPCVVIAPDYRKALHAPFPAGFNDCYDTLLWAKENAEALGVLPERFIVAGHSAGGGLTAAVTLRARDAKDVHIAFQMPIYPMIDDRQQTESARIFTDVPVWSARTNAHAWNLYLKGLRDAGQEIPAYAAPARNVEYQGFPPTITFVGELEPFRDETLAYVAALEAAGIPVKFRFYPGCFHGFDQLAPTASIVKDALDFTYESYAAYYDAYIVS